MSIKVINMKKNNKLLNGLIILKKIKKKIKKKILKYKSKLKKKPYIIILYIGTNSSSELYIKNKCKYLKYVDIKYKILKIKSNVKESKIIKFINFLNKNKHVDCILIQLPLPKKFNTNLILKNINPKKDVDGLHPYNIGLLSQGKPKIRPCTLLGILILFKYYKINLLGLHSLIIGSSNLIGKPIIMELINQGCSVTITNSKTKNIKKHIKNADLLIIAIGKYNTFPVKWIKNKCIIIDIGINKINNKTVGDIEFKKAIKKAKFITPVPGGIGPITIGALLLNILRIYKNLNFKN